MFYNTISTINKYLVSLTKTNLSYCVCFKKKKKREKSTTNFSQNSKSQDSGPQRNQKQNESKNTIVL